MKNYVAEIEFSWNETVRLGGLKGLSTTEGVTMKSGFIMGYLHGFKNYSSSVEDVAEMLKAVSQILDELKASL